MNRAMYGWCTCVATAMYGWYTCEATAMYGWYMCVATAMYGWHMCVATENGHRSGWVFASCHKISLVSHYQQHSTHTACQL